MNKQRLITLPYEIVIERNNGLLYFDIGRETTDDIAEAVVLLSKSIKENDPIWDIVISDADRFNIDPIRSLYWLSGGDKEWESLSHYKKRWKLYNEVFLKKFKTKIINVVRKSNSLKDLKDHFDKEFDLLTMYEFSLENNLIK